jgi:hypothetical protein
LREESGSNFHSYPFLQKAFREKCTLYLTGYLVLDTLIVGSVRNNKTGGDASEVLAQK